MRSVSSVGKALDPTQSYLRAVSESIAAERKKARPNFLQLYRAHAGGLRELAHDNNSVAQRLLRHLLLAQTSPDPEIDDTRDSYTGEKLPICTSLCENFEGVPDGPYRCKTGIACLLGELCPWEDEPHISQGSMTWRNLPMPPPVLGIDPGLEGERFWMEQELATESLCREDELLDRYRDHWAQYFDEWEELREFKEEPLISSAYDNYYQALTMEMPDQAPSDIPALKFELLHEDMCLILDRAVDAFLEADITLVTLCAIFYPFINGCALNLSRPGYANKDLLHLYETAQSLREKYRQWLAYVEDFEHILPLPDQAPDWAEEDGEMIDHWVRALEEQEKRAYKTELDWEAEMAYRRAACHGSREDARRAAVQVRTEHREKSYLAQMDQHLQSCGVAP